MYKRNLREEKGIENISNKAQKLSIAETFCVGLGVSDSCIYAALNALIFGSELVRSKRGLLKPRSTVTITITCS